MLRFSENNIVGLSGGKDSTATCIELVRLGIPFKTVTAEVWWKKDVTGENPYHYEFLHDKLLPRLRSWGVQCDVVSSDITAYEYMTTPIVKSRYPERIGKRRGFPLCGRCGIQRDCKIRPCNRYYKTQKTPYNIITGIARDEIPRLISNAEHGRISVLDLLEIEQHKTYGICRREDLLSPTYSFSERGGCWFCANQRIQEFEMLYREFPNLWNDLMEVQRMPNKVSELFNRTQTLYDIEKQIKEGVQLKFFPGNLL